MTAQFEKGLLWVQPETIASGIIRAIDQGKHEVCLPWFWKYIMLLIKSIPEGIFKRLRL